MRGVGDPVVEEQLVPGDPDSSRDPRPFQCRDEATSVETRTARLEVIRVVDADQEVGSGMLCREHGQTWVIVTGMPQETSSRGEVSY